MLTFMLRHHTYIILLSLFLAQAGGTLTATAQTDASHTSHSVLRNGTWYRLTVNRNGVYAVTTADLAALRGCHFSQLAVYGTDGTMLNLVNGATRPDDLQQISAQVVDNDGDGIFDDGDKLLFYAEGPDVWRWDEGYHRYVRSRHIYSNSNYVFLQLDAPLSRPVGNADNVSSSISAAGGIVHLYHELDKISPMNTGALWMGERFTSTATLRTVELRLPGAPVDGLVNVCYAMAATGGGTSQFSLVLNSGNTTTLSLNSSSLYKLQQATLDCNSSRLNFAITFSGNSSSVGYMDFIDVQATVPLSLGNDQLIWHNATIGGKQRFAIGGTTPDMQIWDITVPASPLALTVDHSTGSVSADISDRSTFVAFNNSTLLSPAAVTAVANQDLHGSTNPHMVIIANPAFIEQARQLASLHSIHDGMEVMVATPQQVFNEFSGGKQDPIAIRELLRMFYLRHKANSQQPTPQYLLLLGKGTYDNRNIGGHNLPIVVAYTSKESFSGESNSYTTDDMFGFLDDGERGDTYETMDVSIGRLPAKNTEEARHLVNKIERYMTRTDLGDSTQTGEWRNSITLLADDADPSDPGDKRFAEDEEKLALRVTAQYPQFNFDKIFADAYRQQSGAIGSYYPDVNNALKQRLDRGTLLLNYVGHGSPLYIGTERYIEFADIDGYQNRDRLFLFVGSTCSYGQDDRTDQICGAEAMLLAPNAAVAAISAGRKIPHVHSFNSDLCNYALSPNYAIGDALRMAKNDNQMSHCVCIKLLGDPALRLSLPHQQVVVTAINGKPVQAGINDSAKVLSRVTVEGEVRDSTGARVNDFNGTLQVTVLDRIAAARTLANDNENTEVDYTQQKNVIFKSSTAVASGRFRYSFVVPRDVQYTYAAAKLSHYAHSNGGSDDACGAYNSLYLGGFSDSEGGEVAAPTIRLFMGDSTFRNGGITGEKPYIYAILSDTAGINTASCGLGHDIVATLDGNGNTSIVLNDFYQNDVADHCRGYVLYGLEDVAPGHHSLTLRAWNIYNVSASATIDFVVRSQDTVLLGDFYAAPNPAGSSTQLVLQCNNTAKIASVVITIFDATGHPCATLYPTTVTHSNTIGPSAWQIPSSLTNGIYFARAIVVYNNGDSHIKTAKIIVTR